MSKSKNEKVKEIVAITTILTAGFIFILQSIMRNIKSKDRKANYKRRKFVNNLKLFFHKSQINNNI